ncbi:LONP1 [Cordylochernes scorpioides]|uniref:LONP1 n=1 Tax=Cordylochernes scorpioides TaxID=51811 RepID=A0ABY6L540_9ARAC|nr:LONP1 [Cordylochernes scorpioides]
MRLCPISHVTPVAPNCDVDLQINNKSLAELIRRKVNLNQPYAGIFMKKEENDAEVVENLNEVHPIGTFVQIHEMQNLSPSKLRLVVMAYRR